MGRKLSLYTGFRPPIIPRNISLFSVYDVSRLVRSNWQTLPAKLPLVQPTINVYSASVASQLNRCCCRRLHTAARRVTLSQFPWIVGRPFDKSEPCGRTTHATAATYCVGRQSLVPSLEGPRWLVAEKDACVCPWSFWKRHCACAIASKNAFNEIIKPPIQTLKVWTYLS